jgi:hypothetical protein
MNLYELARWIDLNWLDHCLRRRRAKVCGEPSFTIMRERDKSLASTARLSTIA